MKTIAFLITSILFAACCISTHKNYEGNLQLNQLYVRPHWLCSNDPFEVDTLKVIALKDEYVKYQIVGSYDLSRIGIVNSSLESDFKKGLYVLP